jgi:hypothetical protein
MPTHRSIDDIPAAPVMSPRLPSKTPMVVKLLAETWWDRYRAEGGLDKAPAIAGRRFRLSGVSNRCDRQMWYALTGTPETEPTSMSGAWRMGLGTMVHNELQDVMLAMPGGWRPEVLVDLSSKGVDGSGHIDLVQFLCIHCGAPIRMDVHANSSGKIPCWCDEECDASTRFIIEKVAEGHGNYHYTHDPAHERAEIVVELKTQGGYGFKMKATNFRGPAEGPELAHVLQGAMAGDVLGAPKLIVGYLSLENLSADLGATYAHDETGWFSAEWKFLIDDLRPMLDAEYARIKRMTVAAEAGTMPARELHDPKVPTGAVVFNPTATKTMGAWQLKAADGTIQEAGQMWYCGYCRHRSQCVSDGAGTTSSDTEPF